MKVQATRHNVTIGTKVICTEGRMFVIGKEYTIVGFNGSGSPWVMGNENNYIDILHGIFILADIKEWD